ncbi:hypothetical protein JOM56_009213 [Amanita muscaria]
MAPSAKKLVSVDNTSIPWGPGDYEREDGTLGKIVPQAFFFLAPGRIAPFEYTFVSHEQISNAVHIAAATKAFVEELGTLLFSLQLEKVLGLQAVSPELQGNHIEFTVGRANIFIKVEKPDPHSIPISWYFCSHPESRTH